MSPDSDIATDSYAWKIERIDTQNAGLLAKISPLKCGDFLGIYAFKKNMVLFVLEAQGANCRVEVLCHD